MNVKVLKLAAAGLLAVGCATSAQATSLYPTMLSGNTTGAPDSTYLGAPDDNHVGIGGQIVTYDFGLNRIVNGTGSDFNVYEVDFGVVEFGSVFVSASLDNITYFDLTGTEAAWVDIMGDEAHSKPSFARSYDLAGLSEARYIRIDGSGTGPAGGNRGFDLDAIGAINYRIATAPPPSAVPLPAGLPLLLGGLGALGWLRKRRKA